MSGVFGTNLPTKTNSFRPLLEVLEDRCVPATVNTWSAADAIGTWNTAANWSLGHVPTSSEIATFDASSTAFCIIDAPAMGTNTVSGINMTATYAAGITDTADLTIGADGFVGGVFAVSGSATILVAGDWSESVSGGFIGGAGTVNFNSASSQTIHDVNSAFTNLTHSGAGTLNLTAGMTPMTIGGDFINGGGANAHGPPSL